jgi:DNA-binding GntR family transcriptional regulator
MWRAAGVEQLSDMIRTLWDLGAYYRTLVNRRDGVAHLRAIEHGAILSAFQNGSLEDAIESIRQHRLQALDRVLDLFAGPSKENGAADKAEMAQNPHDQAAGAHYTIH